MPIANGFLGAEDFATEYFFDLEVGFCPKCKMVQLARQPEREKMFHENYAFFSSTSKGMALHFKELAEWVKTDYLAASNDPFVVEIGSNDGVLLGVVQELGARILGVDPALFSME